MQTTEQTLRPQIIDEITKVVDLICAHYKVTEETRMLLEMAAYRGAGIVLKEEEKGDGWQK